MKQPDDKMRELGFTDCIPEQWFLYRELNGSIELDVTINKETWETKVDVIDDDFGEHYRFANSDNPFKQKVQENYKEEIARLVNAGVLEDS